VWCILTQSSTVRKHCFDSHLKHWARNLWFNREMKITKTVQQLFKKNHDQTEGGDGRTPPLNMPLSTSVVSTSTTCFILYVICIKLHSHNQNAKLQAINLNGSQNKAKTCISYAFWSTKILLATGTWSQVQVQVQVQVHCLR